MNANITLDLGIRKTTINKIHMLQSIVQDV